MNTLIVSKRDAIVLHWIVSNGYEKSIAEMNSVEDLKRWVLDKFKPVTSSFIKGAQHINWGKIFEFCKEVKKNEI